MIVMGEFYEEVDHVEYQAVAPGGRTRAISMEEGRKWEGIDLSGDNAPNWRNLLSEPDQDLRLRRKSGTFKGPVWSENKDERPDL
ncbi:hypothetical protein CBR_g37535 [Chara braunii]|uniref:Uncharacterized protein n=1 Tax=Chara braunii TaxID=69332 RepID=A0A388LN64_CHABU|nr:hypothetical protein CBR_g37535 [Chara braunii]|eukprot:GBG83734.1 hypothetical protein CBR_g37535 [Chara braunii]